MNPKSPFGSFLASHKSKFKARSIFSGLTGLGDSFGNYRDAILNTRTAVAKVDLNTIPVVDIAHSRNSYLLDFLIHGRLEVLPEDNGLSMTEAYASIDSFIKSLQMVAHALKQIVPDAEEEKSGDILLDALRELIQEMTARLTKQKA